MIHGTHRYPPMDRVIYGIPLAEALAEEVKRLGAQAVYVMASGTLNRETDVIDTVRRVLGNRLAGVCAKIGSHTPRSDVVTATNEARAAKADLILTVGGGSVTDAETTLTPIYRTRGPGGVGDFNYGQVNNPKMDQLAAQSSKEPDPVKREALIKAAIKEHNDQVHHIPLHRQFIPWATRSNVDVVHRADNWLEWAWVKIN